MSLCEIVRKAEYSVEKIVRESPKQLSSTVNEYAPLVSDETRRELAYRAREAMESAVSFYLFGSMIVGAVYELYCGQQKTIPMTRVTQTNPIKIPPHEDE